MYIWVTLQVRGRDGMSTPQNGAAAYSQSHVSRICQGGFPLPSRGFRLPNVPPNRRGFSLTSLSLTSSHIKSVYTIQPVVKPVVKRVWQPAASCKQTSNLLSNRLYNRIAIEQPVVKPVWQPVECLYTRYNLLTNRLTTGCVVYTNMTTGLTTGRIL